MGGVFGHEGFGKVYAERLGEHATILLVGVMAGTHVALLDKQRYALHLRGCVVAGGFLVVIAHQSPQFAGLGVVIVVILALVIVIHLAMQLHGRLFQLGRFFPFAKTVRLISYCAAEIAVGAHLAIAMIGMEGTLGHIDGYEVIVDTETVTLRVAIGEEPALKHLVG